jgi:hypothetical protein
VSSWGRAGTKPTSARGCEKPLQAEGRSGRGCWSGEGRPSRCRPWGSAKNHLVGSLISRNLTVVISFIRSGAKPRQRSATRRETQGWQGNARGPVHPPTAMWSRCFDATEEPCESSLRPSNPAGTRCFDMVTRPFVSHISGSTRSSDDRKPSSRI